jgi:hypothetical protein
VDEQDMIRSPGAAVKRAEVLSLRQEIQIMFIRLPDAAARGAVTCVLAVLLMLGGCASAGKPPAETGFLSDYSRLQPDGKSTLRYVGGQMGNYSVFIIDPVRLFIHEGTDVKVSKDKRQEAATYARGALVQALENAGYHVTSSPHRNTARVRMAITDIKLGTTALNVLPQTRLTGLGLGGASVEAEIVNSVTGEQLAAVIESRLADRLDLPAGWSSTGDAHAVIDYWAKELVKRLDKAHGR